MFSRSGIGHTLLVALIFLLVFAVLGFGIYFLYDKFLVGDNSSALEFSSLAAEGTPKKGQAVDIVIQDEDLPSDNNTNQYFVGSNHLMLNAEDLGQGKVAAAKSSDVPRSPERNSGGESVVVEKTVPPTKTESSPVGKTESSVSAFNATSPGESSPEKEFVPIRNLETLYNVSGKEAAQNEPQNTPNAENTASSPSSGKKNFGAEDEQLDTLPNLDDYAVTFGGESSSLGGFEGQNVNNDSDFAPGGVGTKNMGQPEVKDAELMAKAISTILSSER